MPNGLSLQPLLYFMSRMQQQQQIFENPIDQTQDNILQQVKPAQIDPTLWINTTQTVSTTSTATKSDQNNQKTDLVKVFIVKGASYCPLPPLFVEGFIIFSTPNCLLPEKFFRHL